jgi:4-hydroxy-tetrahydrodipicolinate reductase
MIKIVISGPYGRMGQALCRLVNGAVDLDLAGGLVSDSGAAARGDGAIKPACVVSRLAELTGDSGGEYVLIDFTEAAATVERLREAADLGVPAVIGTTGFSAEQQSEIAELARRIPVLLAANMSVGVNVLLGIVEDLAARLQGYDIEVVEMHHRLKKDAPSGTALAFAKSAAAGRNVDLGDVARHGREGMTGERTSAEIGIHSIRGGDVVGDHTVMFAGIGERIEITHKASSRDAFASGALTAARFIAGCKPGLYSMKDALGLH